MKTSKKHSQSSSSASGSRPTAHVWAHVPSDVRVAALSYLDARDMLAICSRVSRAFRADSELSTHLLTTIAFPGEQWDKFQRNDSEKLRTLLHRWQKRAARFIDTTRRASRSNAALGNARTVEARFEEGPSIQYELLALDCRTLERLTASAASSTDLRRHNPRLTTLSVASLEESSGIQYEPLALDCRTLERLTASAASASDRRRHNPRLTALSVVDMPLLGGLGIATACDTYLPACANLRSVTLHFVMSLLVAAPLEHLRGLTHLEALHFVIIDNAPEKRPNVSAVFWDQFAQHMKKFSDVPGVCSVRDLKISVRQLLACNNATSVTSLTSLPPHVVSTPQGHFRSVVRALPLSLRRLEFDCEVAEPGFFNVMVMKEFSCLTECPGMFVKTLPKLRIALVHEFVRKHPALKALGLVIEHLPPSGTFEGLAELHLTSLSNSRSQTKLALDRSFPLFSMPFPQLRSLKVTLEKGAEYVCNTTIWLPNSLEEILLVNCFLWGDTRESLVSITKLKSLRSLSITYSGLPEMDYLGEALMRLPLLKNVHLHPIAGYPWRVNWIVMHPAIERCTLFMPHQAFVQHLITLMRSPAPNTVEFLLQSVENEDIADAPPKPETLTRHFGITYVVNTPDKFASNRKQAQLKPWRATRRFIETERGIGPTSVWLNRQSAASQNVSDTFN